MKINLFLSLFPSFMLSLSLSLSPLASPHDGNCIHREATTKRTSSPPLSLSLPSLSPPFPTLACARDGKEESHPLLHLLYISLSRDENKFFCKERSEERHTASLCLYLSFPLFRPHHFGTTSLPSLLMCVCIHASVRGIKFSPPSFSLPARKRACIVGRKISSSLSFSSQEIFTSSTPLVGGSSLLHD